MPSLMALVSFVCFDYSLAFAVILVVELVCG